MDDAELGLAVLVSQEVLALRMSVHQLPHHGIFRGDLHPCVFVDERQDARPWLSAVIHILIYLLDSLQISTVMDCITYSWLSVVMHISVYLLDS